MSEDKKRSFTERSATTSMLVDFVSTAEGQITDEQLMHAGGLPDGDSVVRAMQRVRKIVLREHDVWWKRIPKVGYEKSIPKDAIPIGRDTVARVHHASKRGMQRIGGCGDFKELTPEERSSMNATASALGAIFVVTQTRSLKRLEGACAAKADRLQLGETLKAFGV